MTEENDNVLPMQKLIDDQLSKLDKRAVGIRFTVDGERTVLRDKGKLIDAPLDVEELAPLPKLFGDAHRDVMETIFSAVSQINENPKRVVPLTRSELVDQFKVSPKALRQLEKWGYVRQRIIKLVPKEKPRQKEGQARAVCYFLPQGRAYVRENFDPAYGLVSGAAADSSNSVAGSAGEPVQ